MKRLSILALKALIIFGFGFAVNAKGISVFAAKKPKIGFVLKTFQEERYKTDKEEFTKEVEKLGGRVYFASCNNDEPTQISKVETLLTRRVDVLVLQPVNSNTASALVEKAKAKGIKVVAYDSIIKNSNLDYFVTQDSRSVGYLQAEAALKKTNGGKWVLLKGQPGDANAEAFSEGVIETARKHGIEIALQRSHEGWAPERAQATTEDALTQFKDEIQAVIANNSGMAWGALQALEAHNKAGKVFLAGSDADLRNVRAVAQGKQSVEVFKAIKPLAVAAAKVSMDLAKEGKVDISPLKSYQDDLMKKYDKEFQFTKIDNGSKKVPTVITPVYLVTQDSIDNVIVASGFHPASKIR